MILVKQNNERLRALSQIFTTSTFDKVVRGGDTSLTEKRIKKNFPECKTNSTYQSLLKSIYNKISKEYRNEYLYKNNLLNKYLIEKYSLKTTTVLTEFKIGNSIADFVLLNGTARIFEIKTDLDGLEKLKKQLSDYEQFADLVYVVTSSNYVSRILTEYYHSNIGVIEFTEANIFKERKKAISNTECFNRLTIFKTLRQSEYIDITKDYFGFVPNVPNTKIFRACFDLINNIELTEFQKIAYTKLKKRKISCPELFKSNKTPFELKQICYSLDFSKEEYENLYKFLHKTI